MERGQKNEMGEGTGEDKIGKGRQFKYDHQTEIQK